MKIRTKNLSYEEVMSQPKHKRFRPLKQSRLLRLLIRVLSYFELKKVNFKSNFIGMEKLDKKEPCLILMNHSCFIDLKIAFKIFKKRRFSIVCTEDGFIGKKLLMRMLGCISTIKFYTDMALVKDMVYSIRKLKQSILMFPEAGYSFDGTSVVLPDNIGKCLKLLKVPLVIVKTNGAFLRSPLYNELNIRNVDVSADVSYVLSPEEIEEKSVKELNEIVRSYFTFDEFKWQQDNNILITEDKRADGLNRILYKCPHCLTEGKMVGKGTKLICEHCQKEYELTENGYLKCLNGETKFKHIPDWLNWERESVKDEIINDNYDLKMDVDISVIVNVESLYNIGTGVLIHNKNGFHLTGCDGKLDYFQKPKESYSVSSDFYWYEIGDIVCIGNEKARYYCFPKNKKDIVTKIRLAQEEIYKL